LEIRARSAGVNCSKAAFQRRGDLIKRVTCSSFASIRGRYQAGPSARARAELQKRRTSIRAWAGREAERSGANYSGPGVSFTT